MKAVIQKKYGGPEVLVIEERPKPVPKKDDVLIEVYTTSVSSADVLVRSLNVSFPLNYIMRLVFGLRKPRKEISGYTVAGIVVDKGENVTSFDIGDCVYAINGMRGGCYAEFVCVKESGAIVKMLPDKSFEESVPISFGAMSALHIMNKVTIKPKDKVLIYGSSGSVGTYAVQLAKYYGAHVTAVCSTKHIETMKELGVNTIVDYTKTDYTTLAKEYDIVFDAVRKTTKKIGSKILKSGGKYISIKSPTTETKEKLETLNNIMLSYPLKTIIDQTFILDDIQKAHAYVDQGHKSGNVIIKVK